MASAKVVAVAALIAVVLSVRPSAAQSHTQVLLLYSTGRNSPLSMVGDTEIPRTLEQGLNTRLDFYAEYIDRGRFPDLTHQAAFESFLQAKYAGHRFDVVIAVQDAAIDFVERCRETLFAGIPMVFLATSAPVRAVQNATGVVADADLAGTLAMALDLQPDLRHVFVVSDASARGRVYEQRARQEFRQFEPRVAITYLTGLVTSDLEKRLATLPDKSIVYYLIVYEDGAGEIFNPLTYLDRIVAVANAPTYSWSESTMGHGIVGGHLLDQVATMKEVAGLTLRLLRGEPAASIVPISSPALSARQVDWRQIRRWGISPAHVSSDTVVRFREPTIWDRYGAYAVGALALLAAQTALIVALLVQLQQRRRAQGRARRSEQALRLSYERIRDLGRRLLNAQESERARIARELHDDISQQLALLEIDLELLGQTPSGPGVQAVDEILARAHGVASSVHDLSRRLHPTKLRLIGLIGALQGLQAEMSHPGLTVTFTHENVPPGLPPDLTLCLFRVALEGLQNATKYSRASAVTVKLAGEPGALKMTIADDGIGFDVQAVLGQGLGLVSMSERLEALGGRFEIDSLPGAGTRLRVSVPIPDAAGGQSIAV